MAVEIEVPSPLFHCSKKDGFEGVDSATLRRASPAPQQSMHLGKSQQSLQIRIILSIEDQPSEILTLEPLKPILSYWHL